MTEDDILAIDRQVQLANCSATTYVHDRHVGSNGGMRLEQFNETVHLEDADAPVTAEPDTPVAAR